VPTQNENVNTVLIIVPAYQPGKTSFLLTVNPEKPHFCPRKNLIFAHYEPGKISFLPAVNPEQPHFCPLAATAGKEPG
jgi:hypothetical protein